MPDTTPFFGFCYFFTCSALTPLTENYIEAHDADSCSAMGLSLIFLIRLPTKKVIRKKVNILGASTDNWHAHSCSWFC